MGVGAIRRLLEQGPLGSGCGRFPGLPLVGLGLGARLPSMPTSQPTNLFQAWTQQTSTEPKSKGLHSSVAKTLVRSLIFRDDKEEGFVFFFLKKIINKWSRSEAWHDA